MTRMILTAVVLAVAAVAAVSEAKACDACPIIAKQTYQGKLGMDVEEILQPEDYYLRKPRFRVTWWLTTAKKTYELKIGGQAMTRLAEALQGRDVIVTGPLEGDTITVEGIEAKQTEFVGTLSQVEKKDLPVTWKLKTSEGEHHLVLTKAQAAAAKELSGQRVIVKGRLTADGLVVTSIEEAPWKPIYRVPRAPRIPEKHG